MAIYQRFWATSATLIMIAGLLLAITGFPAGSLIVIALFSALTTCSIRLTMKNGPLGAALNLPGYLTISLVGAVTGPGLLGWIGTKGGYGVLLVLLLAGSAPVVVSWLQRRLPSHPDQSITTDTGLGPSIETILPMIGFVIADLETASDETVIASWRSSFNALKQAATATERAAIAETRCQCLNEIERRFPDGFHKWIQDGARAASDPSKYLRPTTTRDPEE